MEQNKSITVVGAGLAGSEAAWQIAQRGIKVKLYEMRPSTQTEVHHTDMFAELVCSNSLRSNKIDSGPGLLKEELRQLNSLIMYAADKSEVPAGGAQAVNRNEFSSIVTEKLKQHPNVEIINEEYINFDDEGIIVCASGPLTSQSLFQSIKELTGADTLYFYDAAAPIITAESIDMTKAFWQSRYDKGDSADYLNCPMNAEEYRNFYEAVMNAEWMPTRNFEKEIFFEGCMPIETMAKRGYQTLLFGPMKPVGLIDPKTNKTPFAVVQLRREDKEGLLFNIVGFQTRTRWGDQKKIIETIPALENAEIVRYGVMHRNTFMNGPKILCETGQMKENSRIFFAGQMTGVEGYIESTASGLVAGINAARVMSDKNALIWPRTTAIGSLMNHVGQSPTANFQPMNINFGLFPVAEKKMRNKKERNAYYAERALNDLKAWMDEVNV